MSTSAPQRAIAPSLTPASAPTRPFPDVRMKASRSSRFSTDPPAPIQPNRPASLIAALISSASTLKLWPSYAPVNGVALSPIGGQLIPVRLMSPV